jgi:hypothetical protein
MYQPVTFSDFLAAFRAHGREEQFSAAAKEALFKYLEELEVDIGEPIELDVVALCCDYREADIDDIINDYDLDATDCEDDEDRRTLVETFLNDRTTVIWSDGNKFLFQQF